MTYLEHILSKKRFCKLDNDDVINIFHGPFKYPIIVKSFEIFLVPRIPKFLIVFASNHSKN